MVFSKLRMDFGLPHFNRFNNFLIINVDHNFWLLWSENDLMPKIDWNYNVSFIFFLFFVCQTFVCNELRMMADNKYSGWFSSIVNDSRLDISYSIRNTSTILNVKKRILIIIKSELMKFIRTHIIRGIRYESHKLWDTKISKHTI